jgi:hypothetical protein
MNSIRARVNKQFYQPYVKNALFENDDFVSTETFLYNDPHLSLHLFKIYYEDIMFVDKVNALFFTATKQLL